MYEKFEALIKDRDITPYRVSKDTGIPTSTLSDWKNGRSNPKADKLKILADYFGVDIKDLLWKESDEMENVSSYQEANEKVELNIEINGIDEASEKAERLVKTLKEAKSLANDLASMDLKINFCEWCSMLNQFLYHTKGTDFYRLGHWLYSYRMDMLRHMFVD